MSRARGALSRHPEIVVVAALALPLLVALAVVHGTHWYPTGDYAQTELNVRAIPSHPPLIGVAGRFGPFDNQHSHPGPTMAYLMWPVYRLLGGGSFGLMVATSILHLAAIVAAVLIARRLGGLSLALLVAGVSAILIHALGSEFFLTPWNPWMPVLAFLLFLVLLFGVARGHLAFLPWAVLVGTHCAQTHISYMVLVHGLLAAAVVWLAFMAWRRWEPDGAASGTITWRRLVRPVVISAGVGFVMWLPPLYDQFRRTHNLSWLFHHFTSPCDPRYGGTCEPSVGLSHAAKALATELNLGGAWISGATHNPATSDPSLAGLVIVALVVVAAFVVALRRRDSAALTLLGVAGVATVLALASASRIIGDFYDYVIRWSWPLAGFGATAALWAIWRAIADRADAAQGAPQTPASSPGRQARWVAGVAAALVLLVPLAFAVRSSAGAQVPYAQESKLTGGLLAQVEPKLDPSTRYLLRWHDPPGLGGVGFGSLLELERKGFTVGTDSWTRYAVLPYRVMPEQTADAVLWTVVGDASIEKFRQRGDAEELGYYDPRTPEQKSRSDADRAEIIRRLTELGRQDLIARMDEQFGNAALIAAAPQLPADVNARVSEYTDLRLPAAVFQVAPGAPLFP